jgi:hypothetical protein
MDLINCPECGLEVNDTAKVCPYCGYKLRNNIKDLRRRRGLVRQKMDNAKQKIIILFAVFLSILVFSTVFLIVSICTEEYTFVGITGAFTLIGLIGTIIYLASLIRFHKNPLMETDRIEEKPDYEKLYRDEVACDIIGDAIHTITRIISK